ncbi:MAG: alpha/beta hydrolase [candidate division WOR-3 bacterium]|nr:MAG: alpha/beta hydrolase [candidate division WOR-3 bacterium]
MVCIIIVIFVLTYTEYSRAMGKARDRLLTGSEILKTSHGDVEYAVQGEGPAALLLHGAGGGYDQGLWLGKVCLGDGYQFISVSRYGYLRSSIPEHASIKNQAALYSALLNHLKIRKVIVIAGSAGGPSATQFANDYPDRCSALVLVSAVSRSRAPGDKEEFYVHIIHFIQQSDYVYWVFTKVLQPTILELMGIPSKVYESFTPQQKELAQEMLNIMHPMSPRYKGTINDGRMLELDSVSTGNLSVPTLIMHARDDALVSYEHAKHAEAKIKQSKLISFDKGGHGLLSLMKEVREYVLEFISGLE